MTAAGTRQRAGLIGRRDLRALGLFGRRRNRQELSHLGDVAKAALLSCSNQFSTGLTSDTLVALWRIGRVR